MSQTSRTSKVEIGPEEERLFAVLDQRERESYRFTVIMLVAIFLLFIFGTIVHLF